MKQYLDLLRDVVDNGVRKPTRAILKSTGEHVDAISVFGRQLRFDLNEGFPLVTTKAVSFDAIAHELVWFLRGDTNIRYLQENGVHIWDAWANKNGDVDHSYPECWRAFGDVGGYTAVDQIGSLVRDINLTIDDPHAQVARRLVLNAWNPLTVAHAALPPCHVMAIFNVTDGRLSCMMVQRSADCFLGVPYNIASYSLLTHVLAQVCGLGIGEFVHSIADCHVYGNHLDQTYEQISRKPMTLPELWINPELKDINDLRREDVDLIGYYHWPRLKGEVAI